MVGETKYNKNRKLEKSRGQKPFFLFPVSDRAKKYKYVHMYLSQSQSLSLYLSLSISLYLSL